MERDTPLKSFSEHIVDRYIRPHEEHEADKVRHLAETLMLPYGYMAARYEEGKYFYGTSFRKTLPDGRKVRETIPITREMDGQALHFTLVAETTKGFIKEWIAVDKGSATANQPIHLIVNSDYANPAAIIFPGVEGLRSASVVVGETVNQADHLQDILSILIEIKEERNTQDFNS